ncbi:MAG: hypothetical protein RL343_143 [Actinomycetota bacterium]
MTKNFKRGAVFAASAAAILSMTVATPSFAKGHGPRGPQVSASSASTAQVERPERVAHIHASLPVTVTAIPTTVTKVGQIVRGAKFVAYKLADDATAIPATQPTTGGKPSKVDAIVGTDNVVRYALEIDAPATSSTARYAIYNAAGVGAFVTVTTDSAGVATATTSAALTTAYAEPTKPAFGEGKGVKGDRGDRREHGKMGRGPIGLAPLAPPAQ